MSGRGQSVAAGDVLSSIRILVENDRSEPSLGRADPSVAPRRDQQNPASEPNDPDTGQLDDWADDITRDPECGLTDATASSRNGSEPFRHERDPAVQSPNAPERNDTTTGHLANGRGESAKGAGTRGNPTGADRFQRRDRGAGDIPSAGSTATGGSGIPAPTVRSGRDAPSHAGVRAPRAGFHFGASNDVSGRQDERADDIEATLAELRPCSVVDTAPRSSKPGPTNPVSVASLTGDVKSTEPHPQSGVVSELGPAQIPRPDRHAGKAGQHTDEEPQDVPADEARNPDVDLEALVTEIIRRELKGQFGELITRNVRKLVRREILRAIQAGSLDP